MVAFGRHPHRRRFAALADADRAAIDRALTLTGMTGMADRAVDRLSGGELQRVWLATCLAQETDVLLFDEPTNHLDLRYQVETLDLIRDLADDHGSAIGVVLHDLSHAAAIADRVVLLGDGRVHASGDPADVLTTDHLTEVYGIAVHAAVDHETGRLRIEPQGRHLHRRTSTTPATPWHHLRREPMRTRTTATILGSALLALLAACGTTQPASSGTTSAAEVTSIRIGVPGRRRVADRRDELRRRHDDHLNGSGVADRRVRPHRRTDQARRAGGRAGVAADGGRADALC